MRVVRKHIMLKGILQGIGFRPTVYRLAIRYQLSGWVINTTDAVRIEIEGPSSQCERFIAELPGVTPAPGEIEAIEITDTAPVSDSSFQIRASMETRREITPIPPDVAICPQCAAELLDSKDRRYLFPFITCTLCGPRYSVVRSFPYDRERTSMADFTMCDECAAEYRDPNNRRFHSQTNSCSKCGPVLSLVDNEGQTIPGDPVIECITLLKQGKIVAIKGIGGFHLSVDALNNDAVQRLRDLKKRPEKPFAVMTRDIEEAQKFCQIDATEAEVLKSTTAPIVLLKARGETLAPWVAPHIGTLGIMLPYAPVHHLLFRHPHFSLANSLTNLVMTSGNLSDEPIASENQDALRRLKTIADAFLIHNREIVLKVDDSIVRVIGKRPTVLRRSRGYVPLSFRPSEHFNPPNTGLERSDSGNRLLTTTEAPTVLAVGADMKNAPAIFHGPLITLGPHVGDLESPESQDYFVRSVDTLTEYLEVNPTVIAYDPHPAYFSSRLAHQYDKFVVPVYHHHAHSVSLLLDNNISGPAFFVVFDGTGYGDDGTIWGGEFLLADRTGFQRLARLRPFPLIGSEKAIREPLRIAAGLLAISNGGSIPERVLPLFGSSAQKLALWEQAWKKGINAPSTSSAGRLFDAAAAIAGFRRLVTFEGQAAMWLESIVDETEKKSYPIDFHQGAILEPDVASLLSAMADDALSGTKSEKLAARFHNSIVDLIVRTVGKLVKFDSPRTVGLTGGCFQNKRLTEKTVNSLEQDQFEVLCHKNVPVNDGGIAVGQAVIGREIWLKSN